MSTDNFDIESFLTIPQIIQARAQATPNNIGWWSKNDNGHLVSTSWQEYYQTILIIAKNLKKIGIKQQERIAFCASNSLAWEMIERAALFIGAVSVGIGINDHSNHKNHIILDSASSILVIDNAEQINDFFAYKDNFKAIIIIKNSTTDHALEKSNITYYSELLTSNNDPIEIILPDSSLPATILYTSGTTGKPKGITYSQRQYLITAQAIIDKRLPKLGACNNPVDERHICWLPLHNPFQRIFNTLNICFGSQSYIIDDPKKISQAICEFNPTIMIGVPRFYEKIHNLIQDKINNFSPLKKNLTNYAISVNQIAYKYNMYSLVMPNLIKIKSKLVTKFILKPLYKNYLGMQIKVMITGSAPIAINSLEFFHCLGTPLLEAYGLSESIIPIGVSRPSAYRLGSVGKTLLYNQTMIASDGEVLLKGPAVFSGYLNELDIPLERFDENNFLKTGDIGYIDNDGFLFLTGRKNDLIKTSTGRRIFPKRIEELLSASPLVENAVLIGNNKKHLSAIIAIAESCRNYSDKKLEQLLKQHLNKVNSLLAQQDQIPALIIVKRGFSFKTGELTNNQKLKRKEIEKIYAKQIDQIYQESNQSLTLLVLEAQTA